MNCRHRLLWAALIPGLGGRGWARPAATAGEADWPCWRGPTGDWGNGPKATPAIDNGKVYTFSTFGQLRCWNLADGKLLWQKDAGNRLKCVELKTGSEKWATPDFALGTMVLVDDCLLILSYDGKLGPVEARPDTYRKLGEMKALDVGKGESAYTAPAVANGKVYVRHLQKLVCYDLMK
jgi:outer membrane protein assembly factor BamB